MSEHGSGKIERWHQTLRSHPVGDYYLPGELEACIGRFVEYYHESLKNLTPADVYFGRGQTILLKKKKDQTRHNQEPPLAASKESHLT